MGTGTHESLQDYFDNYILRLCRSTNDDGFLAIALNGQAEEWRKLDGVYPLAAERANLCKLALKLIETRIRARLDAIEPMLARLDAGVR